MIDKLIVSCVQKYFDENHLWNPTQHGFPKCKFCNTKLLVVILDFQRFVDLAISSDCIYINFLKAFEKVSITILLQNVQLTNWVKKIVFIAGYLNGRTKLVVVGEAMSSSIDVLSGVPRVASGSNFILFIY